MTLKKLNLHTEKQTNDQQRTDRQMLATGFASPTEKFLEERLSLLDFIPTNCTSTFFFEIESNDYHLFKKGDILIIDKSRPVSPLSYALIVYEGEFKIVQFTERKLPIEEKTKQPIHGEIEVWGVIGQFIRLL